MPFSVRNLIFIGWMGVSLISCLPAKGPLKFSDRTNAFAPLEVKVPIGPNYKSLSVNLIEKSCLKCHGSDQSKRVVLEGQENFDKNIDDVLYYIEDDCDFGDCMPPVDDFGRREAPVPSEEVMNALKEYIEKL